jgi:16S rRNA (guanine1516-N2)-methyltransferase
MPIIAITHEPNLSAQATTLAKQLNLPLASEPLQQYDYVLQLTAEGISLIAKRAQHGNLHINFTSGANYHRYRYGGGKGQLLVKACQIKGKLNHRILDLNGGLARDAFVLACLGAKLTVIERNPILYILVKNGLERALQQPEFQDLDIKLQHADSLEVLSRKITTDVIYLDPMYPKRKKSALVKKEMRIIRDLVGDDPDSGKLLKVALNTDCQKVVVKRPIHAEHLDEMKPQLTLKGKSSRFDIYF